MKKKLISAIKLLKKNIDLSQEEVKSLDSILEKVNLIEDVKTQKNMQKHELLINGTYEIVIYSDGACRGNPGPGSYGVYIEKNTEEPIELSAYFEQTTNNQMELTGIITGLEFAKKNNIKKVLVVTDSKYAINGMESWVEGWKNRGWKKADNKTPENLDLWKNLDALKNVFQKLDFQWVKGHNGHPQNERCDELANMELDANSH